MKTALYFGSFNPIHNGHLHVARQALEQQQLDELWLVVSPQNPFKENRDLASEEHRLRMAQLACANENHIRVCDIEFGLPRPSFTIDTVRELIAINPNRSFQLIIGEDNLPGFNRWKEFEALLNLVELVVYPRTNATPTIPGFLEPFKKRIQFLTGDLVDISATDIRAQVHREESISGLTHPTVIEYIKKNNLYS
jgi:nicotinate-nucleotide adenylyltransferase